MGRVNITLNDELEKRFREVVSGTLGFKKGNLQLAIEQAIHKWIEENKKPER